MVEGQDHEDTGVYLEAESHRSDDDHALPEHQPLRRCRSVFRTDGWVSRGVGNSASHENFNADSIAQLIVVYSVELSKLGAVELIQGEGLQLVDVKPGSNAKAFK